MIHVVDSSTIALIASCIDWGEHLVGAKPPPSFMCVWISRSKESLCFRVVKKLPKPTDKRILSDELVVLKNKDSRANYPEAMRRVRALVEIDGKEREMEFLTNNVSLERHQCS